MTDYKTVRMIDISSPTDPAEIGSFPTTGDATSIAVEGEIAYLMDDGTGMRVLNTTDPSAPRETSLYFRPLAVALRDDLALLTTSQGLRIIDLSIPTSPTMVGSFDTPVSGKDIAVVDDLAFHAEAYGLRIIDISDPATPNEVSYFPISGLVYSVAVLNDFAYVVQRSSSSTNLRVIDVGDPATPSEVGWVSVGTGAAGRVATAGDFAYVATGYDGIQVADVSNPAAPVHMANLDTPGHAMDVVVAGSTAVVADGLQGVRVLDISTPSAPAEIASHDTPGYASSVTDAAGLVFAADDHAGMAIFSSCHLFSDGFESEDTSAWSG